MECATSSSLINQLCPPPPSPLFTAPLHNSPATLLPCLVPISLNPKQTHPLGAFAGQGLRQPTPPIASLPPSAPPLRKPNHLPPLPPTANLPPALATPPATPPVSPSSRQNVQIPYLLAVDSTFPHTASKQTPRPCHKELLKAPEHTSGTPSPCRSHTPLLKVGNCLFVRNLPFFIFISPIFIHTYTFFFTSHPALPCHHPPLLGRAIAKMAVKLMVGRVPI